MMRLAKLLILLLVLFYAHKGWAQQNTTLEVTPAITHITSSYAEVDVSIDPKQVNPNTIKQVEFVISLSGKETFYVHLDQIGQALGWTILDVTADWADPQDPRNGNGNGGDILIIINEGDRNDPHVPVIRVTTEIDQLDLPIKPADDSPNIDNGGPSDLNVGDNISISGCVTITCEEETITVNIGDVEYVVDIVTGEIIALGNGGLDSESDCYFEDCANTNGVTTNKTRGNKLGNFNIYPNPSSHQIMVDIEDLGAISWAIYQSNGQLVHQDKLAPRTEQIIYNITALTTGMYWLEIRTVNGIEKQAFSVVK